MKPVYATMRHKELMRHPGTMEGAGKVYEQAHWRFYYRVQC
jgi:hypothetical protein